MDERSFSAPLITCMQSFMMIGCVALECQIQALFRFRKRGLQRDTK